MSFDPYVHQKMLAGFRDVVQAPSGTAYSAFQGFPFASLAGGVAGKTGTAQVQGKAPSSVFAGFFPADNPQYVVVALVEEAGHGADDRGADRPPGHRGDAEAPADRHRRQVSGND